MAARSCGGPTAVTEVATLILIIFSSTFVATNGDRELCANVCAKTVDRELCLRMLESRIDAITNIADLQLQTLHYGRMRAMETAVEYDVTIRHRIFTNAAHNNSLVACHTLFRDSQRACRSARAAFEAQNVGTVRAELEKAVDNAQKCMGKISGFLDDSSESNLFRYTVKQLSIASVNLDVLKIIDPPTKK